MSASVGQILDMLDIPEVSNLYQSTIRNLQPADLIRRLESEKVSTCGLMPELRGRLLRLEVLRSHPHLNVPWFPEDSATEEQTTKPKDDLLTKFFQVTRHQEMELQKMQLRKQSAKSLVEEAEETEEEQDECEKEMTEQQSKLYRVLTKLETAMQNCLAVDGDEDNDVEPQMEESAMYSSSIFEDTDETVDEAQTEEKSEDIEEYVVTEPWDDSDESIVKISSDQEPLEKWDVASAESWDSESNGSWVLEYLESQRYICKSRP